MLYKFTLGRWYYSPDNGVSWYRTRYDIEQAPRAFYSDSNPKLDCFSDSGRYICSTNFYPTCREAFAAFAVNHPHKGVARIHRSAKA